VAVVAAALLSTAAAFSVRYVRGYQAQIKADFEQDSHSALLTYATLSRTALLRGDVDSLKGMASFLLDSRAVFVQIVVGEREILSVRREESDIVLEPFPLFRLKSGSVATIHSLDEVLDLAIPIESADAKPEMVGYTRIAFDADEVAQLVASRTRAVIGANVALFIILLVPLAWLIGRQRIGSAIKKPSLPSTGEVLMAGPLTIDLISKEVSIDSYDVHLTPKQFALLSHIARCPNRVFSDRELIESIWPTSAYASAADVKQCVYTLRKRLARACDDPSALIVNVQGYGYKLSIPQLDRDLIES